MFSAEHSPALSNSDRQEAVVTTMKQKFNKELDHSTMYRDFSQVHVVSRKALKLFVSVGNAETESEDVRVCSGAKHCSSTKCFLRKGGGGAGVGGSQI